MLLEERCLRHEAPAPLAVPTRVPASRFKDYVDDPVKVAAELRRPLPQRPYRATRIGTLFHSWVEERADGVPASLDADTDDGLVDWGRDPDDDVVDPVADRLAALQATFAASEWGHRRPIAVELELHLPIGAHVFVCKLDAVYDVPPESEHGRRGIRYQVVDWKTGAAPRDARELELKQTQLALYRLAYANWMGVEPDAVDAVFYYVDDDLVVRPEVLYDEAALGRAWASVESVAGAAPGQGADGSEAPVASLPDEVRAVAEPAESPGAPAEP